MSLHRFRVGWVSMILLVALATGAWLVAGLANKALAYQLFKLPSMPALVKSRSSPTPDPSSNQIIAQRNLFGSAMAGALQSSVMVGTNEFVDARPSELQVLLVGTVVAEKPEWSLALISDLVSSETAVYRLEDLVSGQDRLVAIAGDRVWLLRAGVLEVLVLGGSLGGLEATRSASKASDVKSQLGLRELGPRHFMVERESLDAILAKPAGILSDLRVVPSRVAGQSGYKLFAIRPGSIFSSMGLMNGDVLSKVNGHGLGDPAVLLELYQKLKSSREVEVELSRRGRSERLRFSIR